jgi:hypothetical protein
VAPTRFIPANAPKTADPIKFYQDKAYRGLPTVEFGRYPLAGWSTFDIDGPLYPDDPGILIVGAVGNCQEKPAPTATTLSGGVAAGVTVITVASGTGYVNGMAIILESGVVGKQESNIVISGGGTTSLTLMSPLRFAHLTAATVSGNVLHTLNVTSPQFGSSTTSGATTTFTATTAVDTSQAWIINQYVGHTVTAGANSATVLSNTATTLTTTTWAPGTPSANTVFTVQGLLPGSYIQPPSFTMYDFYGEAARQYPSSYVSDVGIKWSAENDVTYTAKLMGLLSSLTTQVSSVNFTTVPPFVGWQSGFAQTASGSGGSATTQTNLLDLSFDIKRTITPIVAAANTQSPVAFFPGPVSMSGKATFYMNSETEYNHFRNSDHPLMQFGLYGPVGYPSGTPAASGLLLQLDNPTYTAATIDRAKEYVVVSVTFECAYSATDNGPAVVYLTNGLAAYNS